MSGGHLQASQWSNWRSSWKDETNDEKKEASRTCVLKYWMSLFYYVVINLFPYVPYKWIVPSRNGIWILSGGMQQVHARNRINRSSSRMSIFIRVASMQFRFLHAMCFQHDMRVYDLARFWHHRNVRDHHGHRRMSAN